MHLARENAVFISLQPSHWFMAPVSSSKHPNPRDALACSSRSWGLEMAERCVGTRVISQLCVSHPSETLKTVHEKTRPRESPRDLLLCHQEVSKILILELAAQ